MMMVVMVKLLWSGCGIEQEWSTHMLNEGPEVARGSVHRLRAVGCRFSLSR
jgi:hypothetical protein